MTDENGSIEGAIPVEVPEKRYGRPLWQVENPVTLREMVSGLWQLLDDIDTLDDAARDNDRGFRDLCRRVQRRRHQILTSDGYGLFLPEDGD